MKSLIQSQRERHENINCAISDYVVFRRNKEAHESLVKLNVHNEIIGTLKLA
jgi:hypothetical protein